MGTHRTTTSKNYRLLEDLIRRNSTSFYKAFRTLPPDKKEAVFAVYGFCRTIDDIVDENPQPLNELKAHQDRFQEVILKVRQRDPLWDAFYTAYHRFHLRPDPFMMMYEGQTMDLDHKTPNTKTELDRYCDLVAGSVGLMIMPILTATHRKDPKRRPHPKRKASLKHLLSTEDFARSLGRAMQYTNILRDIGEDLRRERSYIPPGLSQKDMGMEAMELYQRTMESIHLFDRNARLPVLLAIHYYQGILKKIIRKGYPGLVKRTILNKPEKLLAYLAARFQLIRSIIHEQR